VNAREPRTILTAQMLTQCLNDPGFTIEATDMGVLVHWGDECYVINSVTFEHGFSPRLVLELYECGGGEVRNKP
jgi:hypothetical protein